MLNWIITPPHRPANASLVNHRPASPCCPLGKRKSWRTRGRALLRITAALMPIVFGGAAAARLSELQTHAANGTVNAEFAVAKGRDNAVRTNQIPRGTQGDRFARHGVGRRQA